MPFKHRLPEDIQSASHVAVIFHTFPDFIPYKGLKGIPAEGGCFLYKAGTLLLLYYVLGEVAESVDGSRLLSGCGGKTSPRVRIPASPPFF